MSVLLQFASTARGCCCCNYFGPGPLITSMSKKTNPWENVLFGKNSLYHRCNTDNNNNNNSTLSLSLSKLINNNNNRL